MNLPLPNTTSVIVYNADFDGRQKESLTSTRFWKRFSQMKIEGCSVYIKYFEPRLRDFETELQHFKNPAEEAWVKSIAAELEREKAQLELFKSHRKTFGEMARELRVFDEKKQEDEGNLLRMKSDLKLLQEDCQRLNKKLIEEKVQLEGKLNKLENMILSSSPEAPEKANKLSKMAAVYDQRIAESTRKTTAVQKKSEDIFRKFEKVEVDKAETLLQKWKTTMANLDKNYKEFRRTLHFNKGANTTDEIDVFALLEMTKRNRQRIFRYQNFQKSSELIQQNRTCSDYYSEKEDEKGMVCQQDDKTSKDSQQTDEKKKLVSTFMDGERDLMSKDQLMEDKKVMDCKAKGVNSSEREDRRRVQKKVKLNDVSYEKSSDETEKAKTIAKIFCISDVNGVGTTRPLPITKMQCLNDQTSDHGEDEDPRINHRRPLPQPGSSCKSQAQVAKPSLRADIDQETFSPYVVKIKIAFHKEVEGHISVKKGDKVKIISKPVDGFVMAKKKTKLGKNKQGLIPAYTYDTPTMES